MVGGKGKFRSVLVYAASSHGRGREPGSVDSSGVKNVERIPEQKRRAELSARIAAGEFTVQRQSGYALFFLAMKLFFAIKYYLGIFCFAIRSRVFAI